MVAVQLEWREFPFCVGPGFLPYKNRLWSARNFGLWSRSTSLPCTYSMMPIITVIIECPVCLVVIHCSYSFPWHMMVARHCSPDCHGLEGLQVTELSWTGYIVSLNTELEVAVAALGYED